MGTSQDANVDTAAKAWGTKYLQKTSNSNNATLTFKYDSFINAFKSGQTFYTIDWSTVEYPTGNYDEAIIKYNRDLGVASSSTAAHEIGHALGLTHRMTEKKSIMYPILEDREVNTPQSTDFSNAVHVN